MDGGTVQVFVATSLGAIGVGTVLWKMSAGFTAVKAGLSAVDARLEFLSKSVNSRFEDSKNTNERIEKRCAVHGKKLDKHGEDIATLIERSDGGDDNA